MLFESERHESLSRTTWDPAQVRASIQAIVTDSCKGRGAHGHWPVHPLDAASDIPEDGSYKSLYLGRAGVLWALWYLQREGAAVVDIDLVRDIASCDADYRQSPDTGQCVPSYFLGEVGIRMVRWSMSRSPELADQLYAAIQINIGNPTHEALWAAPGTMLAAWHLWSATSDERWRLLFAENVDYLWRTWLPVPGTGYSLWTQDLYGEIVQLLGAAHGFVGNLYPLLLGANWLDEARRETLYSRCLATLQGAAIYANGMVNWPPGIGTPRTGREKVLMQWCHGAPGMVTSLAAYPKDQSPEMETLLHAAGEAIWVAGPLVKGYGLCHGTAGNGYAFLKLYRRTGNTLWLERARAFAMHAIGQLNAMRDSYGQGRFTLWNGDTGLAIYLWHCLTEQDALPTLDIMV